MPDKDVLRVLAEESLERGVHPDRERVLRDFVGDRADDGEPTDEEGQGAGGEEQKRRDSGDEPVEKSPTTAPERGTQRGRSGR